MWWKTTEVYRVPLPYSKINALSNDEIKVASKVGIFTHSIERATLLIRELNEMAAKNGIQCQNSTKKNCLFEIIITDVLSIEFDLIRVDKKSVKNVKTPAILEANVLKAYPIQSGDFLILEWEKFTEDILVTSERSALISSQTCKFAID